MNSEIWSNFVASLRIMGQGMGGVFAVILLITLLVLALNRFNRR